MISGSSTHVCTIKLVENRGARLLASIFLDFVVQMHYFDIIDLHACLDSLLYFVHADEKYAIALYPWYFYKYFQLESKVILFSS